MKTTVIVGASPNPHRYAHMAAESLKSQDYPFIPLSIKRGDVLGEPIENINESPELGEIDTLTMYVSASRIEPHEAYLLSLHPKRIIFNPGAENPRLENKARAQGVEVLNACTLVLLGNGLY